MENFLSGFRVKVLVIRVILGVLLTVLLARLFIPGASAITILALAGALVFSAYVLEFLRTGKR
jgi:hypothetical protein